MSVVDSALVILAAFFCLGIAMYVVSITFIICILVVEAPTLHCTIMMS